MEHSHGTETMRRSTIKSFIGYSETQYVSCAQECYSTTILELACAQHTNPLVFSRNGNIH